MSAFHTRADVKCPFYESDDAKARICCEGIMDDSRIVLRCGHKENFRRHLEVFCMKHYEKCEIYRLVEEKYQ